MTDWVRFEAGGELFALPLLEVREVVPPHGFALVPLAPPFTLGVMNVHGRVFAVVDLAGLMGGGSLAPPTLCVLLDDGRRRLGLGVASVAGVGPLEEVEGDVARAGDRAVTLLSREQLFKSVDLAFQQDHMLQSGPRVGEEA